MMKSRSTDKTITTLWRWLTLTLLLLSVGKLLLLRLHKRGHKEVSDLQDLLVRQEYKVQQDLQDQQGALVLLELQGLLAQLDLWAQLALQGLQERLELPEQLDQLEASDLLVQQDLKVASAIRDLQDLLGQRGLLAVKARLDQQVRRVQQD